MMQEAAFTGLTIMIQFLHLEAVVFYLSPLHRLW